MDRPTDRAARWQDVVLAVVVAASGLLETWIPLPSALGEGSPVGAADQGGPRSCA